MRAHTRTAAIGAATLLGLMAGAATAGEVFFGSTAQGDTVMTSNFANTGLAGDGVNAGLIRTFKVTSLSGNTLQMGGSGLAGSSQAAFSTPAGNFYLGAASGLGTGNYNFNDDGESGGQARTRINNFESGTVLGFGGNGPNNAKTMNINFTPGVQAFGFYFTDVGELLNGETGVIKVTFNDGTESIRTIDPNSAQSATNESRKSGFIALVAGFGQEITSVSLEQNALASGDGFSFYGFTTMAVVPLPPAAWAGLAVLGGVAGVRKIRRRG